MKKVSMIILKILLIAVIFAASLVLLVWGGLNIAKFFIYSDYYSSKTNICKNPGIHDNFVCQGIAVSEENEKILVCGYMTDKTNSRIYVTDSDNDSYYVNLTRDGEVFTGHAGGMAITGDTVYLANGSKLYTFSLSEILSLNNGDSVDIGKGTKVNNSASFVYSDENYVYVGEFHDGGKYITKHPYQTNDGLYHAIITKYSVNDLTTPIKIYSVRDKVQGACFTPDGKVVLSTSYGLSDTVYYVYNEADAIDSGLTLDGAPLYYLNGCVKEMKGPAMGEDLDYYEGKVITLTESASDKYIFGKFFFANKIVAIEF
ncbi:MAG: hypothetical protein J6D45_06635 [Clostridia bacterium]|nr:hypothetical protein [Clostridia bacterium]